jgi:YD repeat-containing protein
MKRSTYSIHKDFETLINEEVYDANGNCILTRNLGSKPISENHMEYNADNLLIVDRELSGGVEVNRTEFELNDNGVINRRTLYFGDSIYEDIVWTKTENGRTMITTHDGEITEKSEENELTNTLIYEFYEAGELIQVQTITRDLEALKKTTVINDLVKNVEHKSIQHLNDKKAVILHEEFGKDGELLRSVANTFHDDLIETETYSEFQYNDPPQITTYTYDSNDNLIKTEVNTPTGTLLSFRTKKYDDQNRVIEEAGSSLSSGGGLGSGGGDNSFHFVIRYEE